MNAVCTALQLSVSEAPQVLMGTLSFFLGMGFVRQKYNFFRSEKSKGLERETKPPQALLSTEK